nr:nitroreductase family protein [Micromonospora sp. DSM 115978]
MTTQLVPQVTDGPDSGWRVHPDGSPGPALADCLLAAMAAPSKHNSQPWRFALHPGGIDVYADRSRRLPVTDPLDRELTISVGAAVFNLRVAVLAHGRLPLLTVSPDPARPDLLARLTLGPRVAGDDTVRLLHRAIPRRHTNRRPFRDVAIPGQVLDELAAAARAEGAVLTVPTPVGERRGLDGPDPVLEVVGLGDRHCLADPAYWLELDRWTREWPGRRDGVPSAAFGPWPASRTVPIRDFGLLRLVPRRGVRRFERRPTVAVLRTTGDRPRDWLRAGQALQRVLLTATVRGLASTLMTQPLEVPRLRAALADPAGRTAQVVIRFGYGPPSAAAPRRPLADLLGPPPTG